MRRGVSLASAVSSRRTLFFSAVCSSGLLFGGLPVSPSTASTTDPKTGILLPSEGEIESSIPATWENDDIGIDIDDDDSDKYSDKSSFSRLDPSPDAAFYAEPRFVEHVDERAAERMASYISDRLLHRGDSVLDLCSSWTSHIRPPGRGASELGLARVAGLGMNAEELGANPSLTEWTVMDLNDGGGANTPGGGGGGGAKVLRLPYDDSSFDVVLMQLSVDYLVRPLEVMREASRVLRGGGKIAVLFSNRLFLSKAVGLWTGSDDVDHAYTVGSYLHYCGGGFKNITAEDLSTRKRRVGGGGGERVNVGDPLYVVTATKGQ
jgi:SAM-dependent methyltransferase